MYRAPHPLLPPAQVAALAQEGIVFAESARGHYADADGMRYGPYRSQQAALHAVLQHRSARADQPKSQSVSESEHFHATEPTQPL